MSFYGAANALGYGIGAVLVSPKGMQYPIAVKLTFPCTTSQSMKSALLGWLQAALEMKIRNLEVYGDSSLILFKTIGKWKTQDPKLLPYHRYLIG